MVGVSTSCGSLWFLDAGGVSITELPPISPRFLTQDDRIAIVDGLRTGLSRSRAPSNRSSRTGTDPAYLSTDTNDSGH